MKKPRFIVIAMILFLGLCAPYAVAGSCDSTPPPPPPSSPGGDHPDETYAVDSGFLLSGDSLFNSDPNGLIFQNGYKEEVLSVFNGLKKSDVQTDTSSSALDLNTSTPLLLIPSGGLYGLENSAFFKATLDEYVKNGGTLIVFAQQHGYE
ncbi:MAG: hypothetical protein HY753_07075, partial [Nitrospirae bacterium]|nr:hypothetical protein [Nitrospirota bacterium]